MNPILNVPIEVRLVVLGILGAFLGSVVNLAVYRLAWHRRRISPLSAPLDEAPARRPSDRIPILGWLGVRREAPLHGAGFWIRPLVVELVVALGVAALYWWEVDQLGLVRPWVAAPSAAVLHVTYVLHVLLLALMLIGSLIDVDEKLIPDAITVPGTLGGLLAAAVFPWAMLPAVAAAVGPGGRGRAAGLGLPAALVAEPMARLARRISFAALVARDCPLLLVGLVLCIDAADVVRRHGQVRRARVVACLPGCARQGDVPDGRVGNARFGGDCPGMGLWCRALGGAAHIAGWHGRRRRDHLVGADCGHRSFAREAMGFGDVTLMAMIGSFLGWQPCSGDLLVAPFAGLVIGLFSLILHRQSEIPYGPFLLPGGGLCGRAVGRRVAVGGARRFPWGCWFRRLCWLGWF